MAKRVEINGSVYAREVARHREANYSRLFWKFVLLTLLCSVVPLLLVGWAMNLHYTRFARDRAVQMLETRIEDHRKIIELFLKKRTSQLQLIAYSHNMDHLTSGSNLNDIFEMINRDYWAINDLGVISENGDHLAYVGPYDLIDKNYREAVWFKQVMEKGVYISDVFMGFRKEPHFIIAVKRTEGPESWILRATIDTEAFRSLVENVRMGRTGEVYLLNREGIYQTTPRFSGQIMDAAPGAPPAAHDGAQVEFRDHPGPEGGKQVYAHAWLAEPKWMLVISQSRAEVFEDVNHLNFVTLIFLHLCGLAILIVAVFTTRHMIATIRRRDLAADDLNRQLMQTGKLAAIGELSAGVAHEINNPLAIILTECQLMADAERQAPIQDPEFKEQFRASLDQTQVQIGRCKRITHNLLRFARRTRSMLDTIQINSFIQEVVDLMAREAKTSGIKFIPDLQPDLPPVLSDPSQLQQVFLNLITNAVDAHNGKPYGAVTIRTRAGEKEEGVYVSVADTGSGIPRENLEKIFDPFFTTKPVGKGTGLGLSICYTTMKGLGGDISVKSEVGEGTEFTLYLPCKPPKDLVESMGEDEKEA
jgi:two-component system NtrC family sensor kinase